MKDSDQKLRLDQPATYRITVQGRLGDGWSAWFDGMTIEDKRDVTILIGAVADQSALHGLLVKIRNLGLPLLSVHRIVESE